MNDTLGLLLPVCALATVCGGLLLVVAVLIFRAAGGSLPGFLDGWTSEQDMSTMIPGRSRPNLRQRAELLDFDDAVSRHAGEDSATTPDAPDYDAESFDVDTSSPISGRRRRGRRSRSDDEIFGGMLDDDGDGDADF